MNRLITIFFFSLPFCTFGQTYGLCLQVIGATGGSGSQGNYDVSWTVGELAVTTLSSVNNKATQGFHQPDACAVVSTWNLDLEALSFEVFPNPTASNLTIKYDDLGTYNLRLGVFDVLGNPIILSLPLNEPGGTTIDTNLWPAGVYFLQIMDNLTKSTAVVRVIRL